MCFVKFWEQRDIAAIRKWLFLTTIRSLHELSLVRGNRERQFYITEKEAAVGVALSLHASENENGVAALPWSAWDSSQWLRALTYKVMAYGFKPQGSMKAYCVSFTSLRFNPLSSSRGTLDLFRRVNRNHISATWILSRLIYTSFKFCFTDLLKSITALSPVPLCSSFHDAEKQSCHMMLMSV